MGNSSQQVQQDQKQYKGVRMSSDSDLSNMRDSQLIAKFGPHLAKDQISEKSEEYKVYDDRPDLQSVADSENFNKNGMASVASMDRLNRDIAKQTHQYHQSKGGDLAFI